MEGNGLLHAPGALLLRKNMGTTGIEGYSVCTWKSDRGVKLYLHSPYAFMAVLN
jgi:hypothetical protein